jgi:predicted nucleic acid-binding protein
LTRVWVLDAQAVTALAHRGHELERQVARLVVSAGRLRQPVRVPAVVLAECQRGQARTRAVDALLAREPGLSVRDTDRVLARYVGAVLHGAGAGSEYLADAHCVATAVEAGGGVVVTGDPDDLVRLAAPYPAVVVEPLT